MKKKKPNNYKVIIDIEGNYGIAKILIIVILIGIAVGSSIAYTSAYYRLESKYDNLLEEAKNIVGISEIYEDKIEESINDPYIIELAESCKGPDEIECIVKNASSYYYKNNSNHSGLRSPSEYRNNSGVCRDIAVVYSSAFRTLDYKTMLRFILNDEIKHVYTTIYKNYTYCNIEGKKFVCKKLKNTGGKNGTKTINFNFS